MKSCANCKRRYREGWGGHMYMCDRWELGTACYDESDEECARGCEDYAEKDEDEEYTPSASRGDYSPSCPWNAPGMSISDFI